MARRREIERDESDEQAEEAAAAWRSAARYDARIHGLCPRDNAWGDAVMSMSDAELRELAERNADNPGSAGVLACLDRTDRFALERDR